MNDIIKDTEILEDEILSIEEYNVIDTIDIEIDSKSRLFFANDILTHNSGWETSDLNITNVAESAALIHTVDLLFGIVADPVMKARGEYFVKCLANRVAGYENTRKRFLVDWKYARIEEDMEAQIQDMDFIINNVSCSQRHSNPRGSQKENPSIHSVIGGNPDPDVITGKDVNITGKELFSGSK